MKGKSYFWIFLLAMIGSLFFPSFVQAQTPVVRMILFFSPTCVHCEEIINNDLPPLAQKYNDKLQIVGIDVSQAAGEELYKSAIMHFQIPPDRIGVPTLIIGENILVGELEIPEKLPGLIDQSLGTGGLNWPEFPGLNEVLKAKGIYESLGSISHTPSDSNSLSDSNPQTTNVPVYNPTLPMSNLFLEKFSQDLVGNSLAVIVLIGMIISLVYVGIGFVTGTRFGIFNLPNWMTPLLAVVGFGVASYLTFLDITKTPGICGPIGNCNSVQESPYAYLFGVIPVGILGAIGYLFILATWLLRQFGSPNWRKFLTYFMWIFALFGTFFSIYLTFLEPFVIGATCVWCLSSAIIMTTILLTTTGPVIAYSTPNLSDEKSNGDFQENEQFSS